MRAEDAEALRVISGATPEMSDWSLGAYRTFCESAGNVGWVAERNEHVDGFIVGRMAAGEAEILNLAVCENERQRGWGLILLQAFEEDCRAAGAEEIFLEVRESNAGARKFYERSGFTEVGRRESYYPNGEAAICLRKKLAG